MCQLIATNCIWEPVTETIWPIQSKRKSRWRRDEKAVGRDFELVFPGLLGGSVVTIRESSGKLSYFPFVPFSSLYMSSTLGAAKFWNAKVLYLSGNVSCCFAWSTVNPSAIPFETRLLKSSR